MNSVQVLQCGPSLVARSQLWRQRCLTAPDRDLSDDDLLDDGLVQVPLALWALGDHLALDDKLALLVLLTGLVGEVLGSASRQQQGVEHQRAVLKLSDEGQGRGGVEG